MEMTENIYYLLQFLSWLNKEREKCFMNKTKNRKGIDSERRKYCDAIKEVWVLGDFFMKVLNLSIFLLLFLKTN